MSTGNRFARGVFTLSLDFELVWGSRDLYDPLEPLLVQARATRHLVFDRLLGRLEALGMVATWATVGHLFLDQAHRVDGVLHPQIVPPAHAWHPRPWFQGVPEGTEAEHPEFYGRSLVQRLVRAGQEVGSHSFSHPVFGDPGCSRQCADTDLARCVTLARELGLTLRSFVFPRNVVGHLDLVARHGFFCWRGPAPDWYAHAGVPRSVGRMAHLGQVACAAAPRTVMPERSAHDLWNVPASASFLPSDGPRRLIPVSRRVERAQRGLDAAAQDGRLFHLWLHPINLASHPEPMIAGFLSVLDQAARLRDQGRLEVLGMAQVAEKAQAMEPARALSA